MNLKLDTPSRRISFAVGVSILMHALVLWGPEVRLPQIKSSLPPLVAKLEALPAASAKPKRKPRPAAPKPAPEPVPQAEEPQTSQDIAQAPGEPTEAATLPSDEVALVERAPLPRHAQLTFGVNQGIGGLRIGKAIHTLEIDNGRYVLNAVTQTVGLARLFKSYELTQYSSGSYTRYGLQPELFFEQRKDKLTTMRYTAEFDHAANVAHFSQGGEVTLPPATMDILSVMYQFPSFTETEIVPVFVSNGRKIERYEFVVDTEEEIDTPLGTLLTVRLRKLHAANEEGLEIWLAREYRLFPVKIRFIEKNGEVTGEAVITDIRVSEEEGVRSDVVN